MLAHTLACTRELSCVGGRCETAFLPLFFCHIKFDMKTMSNLLHPKRLTQSQWLCMLHLSSLKKQRGIVYWLPGTGGGGCWAQEESSEQRRQKVTVRALSLSLITEVVYEHWKRALLGTVRLHCFTSLLLRHREAKNKRDTFFSSYFGLFKGLFLPFFQEAWRDIHCLI